MQQSTGWKGLEGESLWFWCSSASQTTFFCFSWSGLLTSGSWSALSCRTVDCFVDASRSRSSKGQSCVVGTVRFTAPELLQKGSKPKLTTKADVYSFAIVLWQFAAASEAPPDDPKELELSYLCPFPHLAWSHQVKMCRRCCAGVCPSLWCVLAVCFHLYAVL